MKKMIYMLAAAATLAACHNRGEDDMGAAPDRGDTTAVRTDTTTGGFDTTATAQPSDTSMTPSAAAALRCSSWRIPPIAERGTSWSKPPASPSVTMQ